MDPEVVTAPPAAPPVAAPAPVAPPVAAPVAAPAVAAPAAPAAPAAKPTMLEAIDKGLQQIETNRGKGPRDTVSGKFVPKTSADPTLPPVAKPVAAAPAVPVDPAKPPEAAKPAEPEDPLAMPEGLSPKGQERFQKLANENKVLVEQRDVANRQVEYVKTAFQTNGVQPEQFDQATAVIGRINRGDLEGARKVLEGQLQQIALLTGKPGGQIDALANFPDLRQAVDSMQITETHALELARGRAQRFAGEQRQQQENQQRQSKQQTDEAEKQGLMAVDAVCKRYQQTDMDFPAIEAMLLPEIANLIKGVDPRQWGTLVDTQYRMLKQAAAKARGSIPSTGGPLRPTGPASPGQAPTSMFEAMHGHAPGPA